MNALPALPVRMRDTNGLYSMIAIDQRDSLRAMLADSGDVPVTDDRMREFKVEVARALSPVCSALLVDTDFALQPILDAGALAPGCDLIVAVDAITYDAHGAARATALRTDLLGTTWGTRVAGLKYLLLWTPQKWLGCDEAEVQEFIDEANRTGVESVLEVVVREADGSAPTPERQARFLVEAAQQTACLGASLYKTEVPYRNRAPADDVTRASALITGSIECPWVVLSSGVPGDQFPQAVQRTARGGAEGFLAGRAVWRKATALARRDAVNYLANESVATMAGLREALRAGRAGAVDA
jgi:sulfofructosephosphate aldolase